MRKFLKDFVLSFIFLAVTIPLSIGAFLSWNSTKLTVEVTLPMMVSALALALTIAVTEHFKRRRGTNV